MTAAAPSPRDVFRPELQGLRAVAVVLVVLYHLWPNRLSGGYVGVDVFFVLSGFLITSHLHRELRATGTVRVRRFWARRIRRLLPASLLVLVVSAAAVLVWVPTTEWVQSAREIAASALYVQNWALAADAVDYMAADNVPTVAQHYWSLSVEEQFYLVWPLILLGLVRLAPRGSGAAGTALLRGLTVLGVVSLGISVWWTAKDQAVAYLAAPTRVWEFAAGGLLALVTLRHRLPAALRDPFGWGGLAAVLAAGMLYDDGTPFPGWAALLPVLGTVAVMAAVVADGDDPRPAPVSVARVLVPGPARFLGDVSYAVYLWHWPLVVVWPHVTGVPLRTLDKVAVLLLTVLLAWGTKVAVEDPVRRGALLGQAPWRSFVFAGAGAAVLVGVAVGVTAEVAGRAGTPVPAAAGDCSGPSALDPGSGCASVTGDGELVPAPEVAVLQKSSPPYPGCQQAELPTDLVSCRLGSDAERPERVLALVGDSHATQWFPAFDRLGQEHGWQVRTYTKTGCPVTAATRVLADEQTDESERSCRSWADAVVATLAADPDVDTVVTAAFSTEYEWEDPGTVLPDPAVDGFAEVWRTWTDAGKQVVVLADVPRTQGTSVPTCLTTHVGDPAACAVDREAALPGSALVEAAGRVPGVQVLDLTDRFCDDERCYPVVGDVVVYYDHSHLTKEYATALVPYLATGLAADGGRPIR